MRIVCTIVALWLSLAKPMLANHQKDSTASKWGMGIECYRGYLQYHHDEMSHLRRSPAFAYELYFSQKSNGDKLWHRFYGFPTYGIKYRLMRLGNDEVLGYAHCMYPNIDFLLAKPYNKLNLQLHVGSGIGYMGKVYSASNTSNNAISTHVNAFISLGISVDWRITNCISLNGGLHLSHFSNGSVKKPNYGLNYTLVSVGASYSSSAVATNKNESIYSFSDPKNRWMLVGSAFTKEAKGIGGPTFWVKSLSLEYSRTMVKPLLRYGASIDLMHDNSNGLLLRDAGIRYGSEWELLKVGTAINTEMILNRLSIVMHFGGYLYNKNESQMRNVVYQRIGLRYRTTDWLWLHLALKTHWNLADYIELGVAWGG